MVTKRAPVLFPAAGATAVAIGLLLAWAGSSAHAGKAKFNNVLDVGDPAPTWSELPGVDGKEHSLDDYAEAEVLVVVFTCNRCPVAKGYESRLLEFAQAYAERGVQVVAISVSRNAADGLEKMKVRARERDYPFPYLYDASQAVGRAYGATATPHFFVLDARRRVRYMGAFDDSTDPGKVKRHYVSDAVEALLAGKEPEVKESLQRGCPIEYE